MEIVELVRGKYEKKNQITLEVLIVQEVHQLSILNQMIEKKVQSEFSFEWTAQLRYYIERKGKKDWTLNAKMVGTVREYQYEYLGNQNRLVVTPLTDRCYRTLMSAL